MDAADLTRVDTATKEVAATPRQVYAALLDPRALEAWLPPATMTGTVHELDARPGGRFRMTLRYRDADAGRGKSSSDADVVEAEYAELVADERVVQLVRFESEDPAFAGVMRMSWVLEPTDGGTRVTIRAEDVPEGIGEEDHATGLRSSLENLADYLERRGGR